VDHDRALTVWSGFTALCGMAGSFGQLFLCRMGVGVGEAGGVAPSYSLIADYFPPHQRARALAAYAFGIPLGTAAGTLVGGLLAAKFGWQTAFIAVGLVGLLLAPVLRLTVKDPKRGGMESAAATRRDRRRRRAGPVGFAQGRAVRRPALFMLSLGALRRLGRKVRDLGPGLSGTSGRSGCSPAACWR
jgi:MFS family permease